MPAKNNRFDNLSIWLLAAAALLLWLALLPTLGPEGRQQDFLNLYTGARLARDGQWAQLHDPALQLRYEQQVMPARNVLVPFVRPHVYALFLSPLAGFSHPAAHRIWLALQALAAAGCLWWGLRRFGRPALLIGVAFPGLAIGTLLGQDPALLLATAVAGWHFAEKGKARTAGFFWGLGLVKFHLLFGLAAALLAARRWRFAQGFAASGSLLFLSSLALGGPAGILAHYRLLTNPQLSGLSPNPELMTNVQAISANLGIAGWWLTAPLGLCAVGFFLMALRSGELWRWYASAMVTGVWLVPHVYGYDGSILLPALWLGMFESGQRWTRIAAALYAAPLALWFNLAGPPWAMANSLALFGYVAALGLTAKRPGN